MLSHQKEKLLPTTCGFCGTVLHKEYYFTCHLCGATYCYIHMGRHRDAHTCHACGRAFQPDKFVEHVQGCAGKSSLEVTVPT